jgi:hypothetical protein
MAASGATFELPPEPQTTARTASWLDDIETLADGVTADTASPTSAPGPGRTSKRSVGIVQALVFLRLAEERGLERFGQMRDLASGREVGRRLAALLRSAARRYGVPGLDVAPGVAPGGPRETALARADDGAVIDLLMALYPAVRDELGYAPDILGRLYERSLAEVAPRSARAARSGATTRKMHGVFYTPSRVVDYVVERTLGPLLDDQVEGAPPPRVLDPACGSGAFLLGAYRHLLAWHRARLGDSGPRFDFALRARILEESIFGVDVDATAIEIAKLSLLLACASEAIEPERPKEPPAFDLPRLHRNLRAGHSLIDTDWSGTVDGAAPFPWQRAFAEIFREGGFDIVVGNPPYLSFGGRHAVTISKELRRYYATHYESGGWPTAHALFLERAVKLLSRRFVAFVVPDQLGHLGGYRSARVIAQREAGLAEVRYWGEKVFRGVTTPALTIVLDKRRKDFPTTLVDRNGASRQAVFRDGEPWSDSPAAALLERLRVHSFSLGKLVGDCGIRTTRARDQVVDLPGIGEVLPVLEGKLVDRYGCRPPEVAVRLDSQRPLFISREERYRAVSFVIRQTAAYPIVGPRQHTLYFRNSLLALFAPTDGLDVHYLVALLNSKLLRFVYTETVREAQQRTFPQVKVKALQSLPLRKVDLVSPFEKGQHDALVALAKRALLAQQGARSSATKRTRDADEDRDPRAFAALDQTIDQCVYDLYELSADEREMIEQSVSRVPR